MHNCKTWLKKQANFAAQVNQTKANQDGEGMKVKKQYLMSCQEINQHEIIEQLFKNFDADGSGALDLNELQELFGQNRIYLEKDTIQKMF